MIKICKDCGIEKDETLFYFKNKQKNTLKSSYCIECSKVRMNNYYHSHREEFKQNTKRTRKKARDFINNLLKENHCKDCGIKDIRVLEFDHVRGVKSQNISRMINGGNCVNNLKAEIEKCDIVCANCHRIRTGITQNWDKDN